MTPKGQITREKILESACVLFYLNGYKGTTIDDILERSGVKKGNFYFHFKSKEALGYAVFDVYKADSSALFQKTLQKTGDPINNLCSLFSNHEQGLKRSAYKGGCPFGNLALELADHHQGFRMKLEKVFDGWAKEIRAVLNEAKKRGKLKSSIDTKGLSYLIVAVMEGGTLLCKTKKAGGIYRDIIKTFKSLTKNTK
jgi:TetR/AcrR family transcriptional repressor of nem operon